MTLYGTTILLSAFLLFLVQPLIGKYILPWFGGTPAVWTACMLFFQASLLVGYGYAHVLAQRLTSRRQLILHAVLVAASLAALPIVPSETWKPLGGQAPLPRIFGLLLASIGVPYFLLASTSPLLQSWFGWHRRGMSPYRLYSLSNLGSLLATVSYPFVIEPAWSLHRQMQFWSVAYAAFCALVIGLAIRLGRSAGAVNSAAGVSMAATQEAPPEKPPSASDRVLWLVLAASGSMALLSTTNQLCLDVAVVPLLWILPLALYLISFIICFHHERWYSRIWCGPALAAALIQACVVLYGGVFVGLKTQVASYSFTLFVCCMVCHGELVRLKPSPRHLTSYYLMIAAGGALGGLFVSVLAPSLLTGFWEYHLSLWLTAALLLTALFRDRRSALFQGRPVWAWAALYSALAALAVALAIQIADTMEFKLAMTRNFFGVLRVLEEDKTDSERHRLTLMNGRIEHGFQFVDQERKYWPTSYFGADSGAGIAILAHPRRRSGDNGGSHLRVGVIGLGVGTIASYGEEGDYIRFYEVNPGVLRLSDEFFSYRRDCPAHVEVVLGDARISMERERQSGVSARFDVLIVDAFSGDAIPVHLLTRECFETYFFHLKPDGVLAVHISNRYFELSPVVRAAAQIVPERQIQSLLVTSEEHDYLGTNSTRYVLLTGNAEFLGSSQAARAIQPWPADEPAPEAWSDDFSNLFHRLKPPR